MEKINNPNDLVKLASEEIEVEGNPLNDLSNMKNDLARLLPKVSASPETRHLPKRDQDRSKYHGDGTLKAKINLT